MANDIFVGNVAVGVVPDARGWNQKLRAELVPSSEKVGDEVGSAMGRKITEKMGEAGSESAGAFDETFRKRLKAALEALPKAKIDGDLSPAERKLAELRARIEALSKEKVIDGDKATRELAKIDVELHKLSRDSDIKIKFNTTEARAQLALLRKDVESSGGTYGRRGGILGGIAGIIPGMGQGAGAAPGAAGGAGSAAASVAPAAGGIGAWGWVGIISAALLALPFIAQAAAGAIVAALGGAFVAIGLIGAAQNEKTKKGFTKLTQDITKDLQAIGKAWVPVLNNILSTMQLVAKRLTPVFVGIAKIMAAPVQKFIDTVLLAFTRPAVVKSMQDVAKAFVDILNAFAPDIPGIADSLAQAVSRLAQAVSKNPKAFADFLNFLFQVVIFAINAIAWLTNLATWIEVHLPPTLHHIAVIWDGVRHEIAHVWDGIFQDTIGRIIRLTHNIEMSFNNLKHWIISFFKNAVNWLPSAGAAIMTGFHGGLKKGWNVLWQWYTRIEGWLIDFFVPSVRWLGPGGQNTIKGLWNGMKTAWGWLWAWYNRIRGWLQGYFNTAVNWLYKAGIWLIQGLWNAAKDQWNHFWSWYSQIDNWLIGFFKNAGTWLYQAGQQVIVGMFNGFRNAMAGGLKILKSIVVDPVINAVKQFFGIKSPSTVMFGIGTNVMLGLVHGLFAGGRNLGGFIKKVFGGWPQALSSLVDKSLVDIAKLPRKALDALGFVAGKIGGFASGLWHKVFGGGGSGVQQWAGTVLQALSMLHLPSGLLGAVLYQMQTESGGNPNAINNWDINAKMGDPSRGLMQVIGATFARYHVPGTSGNIYDPLANIAAALNYAAHNRGFGSGPGQLGSGHGYDSGGWLPPGASIAYNGTGRPELVVTHEQLHGTRQIGGTQYHAHFDGLTGAAIESHVRTAFQAMSLTSGALARQGRRS